MLLEDAGQRWLGASDSAQSGIQRAFDHGPMKAVSRMFKLSKWIDWLGDELAVPIEIQSVAEAFISLQEERHTADYDNHALWTSTEVEGILEIAEAAHQDWLSIRADPIAGNYLLSMLLCKWR